MAITHPVTPPRRFAVAAWVFPVLLLCIAYSLLGLTFVQRPPDLMTRCVLMDYKLSRIWSVAHIEIGLAYFGVFAAMAYYALRAARTDRTHLTDLGLGFAYLLFSFLLDFFCVNLFQPFVALLIGDAIVMTFTAFVSRQLWFQRLLGVFVPLVFFTCSLGHFMEGLSFWKLTYTVNVPWTMVTADIGFAILVNAARFPAFIRGHDILVELDESRVQAREKYEFFRDVLLAATEDRLRMCDTAGDLPMPLTEVRGGIPISRETLSQVRREAVEAARAMHFTQGALDNLQTAVGEAALNAVAHAGGGVGRICAGSQEIQIWITDNGKGIPARKLPFTLLTHSFETKDQLRKGFAGQGFWLMLRTAKQIDLLTGPAGTTLVLCFSPDDGEKDLLTV